MRINVEFVLVELGPQSQFGRIDQTRLLAHAIEERVGFRHQRLWIVELLHCARVEHHHSART
jgi:hypothetical protein